MSDLHQWGRAEELTSGSLPRELADEVLEYKLKEKFDAFGTVYVKIKRDYRGMPYAFCQFEVS